VTLRLTSQSRDVSMAQSQSRTGLNVKPAHLIRVNVGSNPRNFCNSVTLCVLTWLAAIRKGKLKKQREREKRRKKERKKERKKKERIKPNMEEEWINLSLYIREFLNWNLGSESNRAGWEFLLFSSVPQRNSLLQFLWHILRLIPRSKFLTSVLTINSSP